MEPSVIAERPERDVATDRFGDAVELLVGRVDDDDTIPRRKELIEEQVVRFDGAGGDENFVRRGVLVGVGKQATQHRAARRFAVSQPQIEQSVQLSLAFLGREQSEDFAAGHGKDATFGDIPRDVHLVFRHPALELKRFDSHPIVPFLAVRLSTLGIVPAGST